MSEKGASIFSGKGGILGRMVDTSGARRILVLNYEYPPLGGGSSPVTQAVCQELVKQGNRVDVVTMAFRGLPALEERGGVRIVRVPCLRKARHICHARELLTWVISAYVRAKRLVRSEGYDLIHSHFFFPSGVVARRLSRSRGVPYVVTSHGSDVPGYNPDRFRAMHRFLGPFWRSVVRDAAAITSPSQWLAELIEENYGKPLDIEIIPNGIDEHWVEEGRKERSVLFVSRLLRRKGAQFLLQALSDVPLGHEVHIVGEGPYRAELERAAKDLPNPVTFHGWLENDSAALADLYRKSSIFAFPSLAENFPVSLLEAMVAGCAIVATDLDSCHEVLGDSARYFAPGDVQGLRRHLVELTENQAAREQLAAAARERIRGRFTWSRIGRRYQDLFESVAGSTAGAPAS